MTFALNNWDASELAAAVGSLGGTISSPGKVGLRIAGDQLHAEGTDGELRFRASWTLDAAVKPRKDGEIVILAKDLLAGWRATDHEAALSVQGGKLVFSAGPRFVRLPLLEETLNLFWPDTLEAEGKAGGVVGDWLPALERARHLGTDLGTIGETAWWTGGTVFATDNRKSHSAAAALPNGGPALKLPWSLLGLKPALKLEWPVLLTWTKTHLFVTSNPITWALPLVVQLCMAEAVLGIIGQHQPARKYTLRAAELQQAAKLLGGLTGRGTNTVWRLDETNLGGDHLTLSAPDGDRGGEYQIKASVEDVDGLDRPAPVWVIAAALVEALAAHDGELTVSREQNVLAAILLTSAGVTSVLMPARHT